MINVPSRLWREYDERPSLQLGWIRNRKGPPLRPLRSLRESSPSETGELGHVRAHRAGDHVIGRPPGPSMT